MGKLVTVIACDMLGPAYIARSKLEDAGIPCYLANEHTVGMHWLYANALGGIQVQVPEERVAEALALLAEDITPDDIDPGAEKLAPDLKTSLLEPDHVCPHCGGEDVAVMSPNRLLFWVATNAPIPLKTSWSLCRCRSCRQWWRERK